MERGHDHTKGTPDVNERSTPHRLSGDFYQVLAPRLDFETFEATGNCQDRFRRIRGADYEFHGHCQ